MVDPGDGGDYQPELDPADFVTVIDNPYLPLTVGSRWVYEGESEGEREDTVVVVTSQTREIEGITAVVVRDTVHIDGVLEEDTYDWFAQDRDGNVWYLGEDSSDFDEDGQPREQGRFVGVRPGWRAARHRHAGRPPAGRRVPSGVPRR